MNRIQSEETIAYYGRIDKEIYKILKGIMALNSQVIVCLELTGHKIL